jgi:hypothetical protein
LFFNGILLSALLCLLFFNGDFTRSHPPGGRLAEENDPLGRKPDALALVGQLLTMMQPQPKAVKEKKLALYNLEDGSYQPFTDSGQLDKWLRGDDMVDHEGGYSSIATL